MHEIPESNLLSRLPSEWKLLLNSESHLATLRKLEEFIGHERASGKKVYPKNEWIFRAFEWTDYSDVKVVILGQDPYHGPEQAIGLSFGVPNELFPKPPSLQNIFKELESDLGVSISKNKSDLIGWAKQGVLLLNTALTVREGEAFSHRDAGWETITDSVIEHLNERKEPVIFILWGAAAQKKKSLISHSRHFILESVHPSPLSAYRGFFGSRPFSKANALLQKSLKQKPIDWTQLS